jgi:hypothetical protein
MNISDEQYMELVNKIAALEAMLSELKAMITGLEPPAVKTAGEWFRRCVQYISEVLFNNLSERSQQAGFVA